MVTRRVDFAELKESLASRRTKRRKAAGKRGASLSAGKSGLRSRRPRKHAGPGVARPDQIRQNVGFAGRPAQKNPRAQLRGAAEGCKANSGILSILPSKFAPSAKDRLKEDRQETLASELRRCRRFPGRSCEFPASLEKFPCTCQTNSLPLRRK